MEDYNNKNKVLDRQLPSTQKDQLKHVLSVIAFSIVVYIACFMLAIVL